MAPASGAAFKAPVTLYFPYSGRQRRPASPASWSLPAGIQPSRSRVCKARSRSSSARSIPAQWSEQYKVWGLHPTDENFPDRDAAGAWSGRRSDTVPEGWRRWRHPGVDRHLGRQRRGPVHAVSHVRRRTFPGSTSDGHRRASAVARGHRRKATVVLEADVFPDTPTETLIGILPARGRRDHHRQHPHGRAERHRRKRRARHPGAH